jgi:levanbiose-producing levanase
MDAPLPLDVTAGLRLRIVVDRLSAEVFADDGKIAMTSLVFPPADANGIEAYSTGGEPGVASATVWALKSTHE